MASIDRESEMRDMMKELQQAAAAEKQQTSSDELSNLLGRYNDQSAQLRSANDRIASLREDLAAAQHKAEMSDKDVAYSQNEVNKTKQDNANLEEELASLRNRAESMENDFRSTRGDLSRCKDELLNALPVSYTHLTLPTTDRG